MQSLRLPYYDVITVAFNDVITFNDVDLNDGERDVHYNHCIIIKYVRILEFSYAG